MRTYLITYDTAAPSRHSIASAIMQLGEAWARPLDASLGGNGNWNKLGTFSRRRSRIAACSLYVPRRKVAHRGGEQPVSARSPLLPESPAMRTYLITYDIANPARHSLSSAIMQLGDAWARPLENTWYVQSPERPGALEERLKDHLEGDDGLLIQQVEANAVLLNTALRWFRKRRLEVASDAANVVAFPVSQMPEAKAA